MVLCEDMHWADSVSLELLDQVVRDVAELPVLLVVTGRPEFSPGWADASHVSTLKLNRLGRQDSAALAASVAGGQALPAELADPILTRTEGVPLFVEEFTRTVLETGAAAQAMERFRLGIPLDIPGSLQESLMVRLDRLGWARQLAQCAAALGSDFSRALLAAVAELAPARLEAGLALLIDAQLVSASGTGSAAIYRFRHALLRDAAYGSLPLPERVLLHARIAAVLARTIPGIAEANPEILAHHLTEAGSRVLAIPLWRRAGEKNIRASANLEAATHFRRALALLAEEAAGPERESLELDIRLEFGVALTGTSGFTAPEFRENTRRALAICEGQHDPARFYPLLWSMVAAAFSAGDVQDALHLASRFLREAEQLGDRQLRMIGHRLCGMASFGTGALGEAKTHLEESLALHEAGIDAGLAAIYGFDQRVATLIYLAHVQQDLGAPAEALQFADRALYEARLSAHASTEIYVRSCLLLLHMARRDRVALAASVREAARVARQHAAYNLQVAAACLERILSLPASSAGDAFVAIQRHIDGLRQFNWIYLVTRINLFAAEMAAEGGHAIEGRGFCEEARALIDSLAQGGCMAELHLVEAAVLRAEGAAAGCVEAALHRAMEAARLNGARRVEVRALDLLGVCPD
jgi:tetratricopeptide (TPR) repeat protein